MSKLRYFLYKVFARHHLRFIYPKCPKSKQKKGIFWVRRSVFGIRIGNWEGIIFEHISHLYFIKNYLESKKIYL